MTTIGNRKAVWITESTHRKLKLASLMLNQSIIEIVENSFNAWEKKHKLKIDSAKKQL